MWSQQGMWCYQKLRSEVFSVRNYTSSKSTYKCNITSGNEVIQSASRVNNIPFSTHSVHFTYVNLILYYRYE